MVRKVFVKKSMFENKKEVAEDFRQAWAEALHIYKTTKVKLILPKDLGRYSIGDSRWLR